ncbi:MAG TPA: outer membrane beta-barrel protein [Pseudomonadales bacterium]
MKPTYPHLAALAAAALFAFAAGPAGAAENGFYIGGSIGSSLVEDQDDIDIGDEVEEFDLDDDDFGWKGFVGFQILPFLAVEGGYVDFGEVEGDTTSLTVNTEIDGWNAFVVGKIPIAFVDVFGKVGIISWDLDVSLDPDADDNFSSSDEDVAYGVGAAINLGKLGIRAEAERFDVSDIDDLYLLSVGLTYTF